MFKNLLSWKNIYATAHWLGFKPVLLSNLWALKHLKMHTCKSGKSKFSRGSMPLNPLPRGGARHYKHSGLEPQKPHPPPPPSPPLSLPLPLHLPISVLGHRYLYKSAYGAALGSVLRTSLNKSEMIGKFPDLLILITDLWLIWFFKRICVLD